MTLEAARPRAQLEDQRPALLGHCYRMLGSIAEAEDAVQDSFLRALKGEDAFEGRAAASTWLYRVATNVCIDRLRARRRRDLPTRVTPPGTVEDPLGERPAVDWLEPVPDASVLPISLDPERRAALRQSLRLAFVAAVQGLPPRQRAALLLKDVLGFTVEEIVETIGGSRASINSALQRARERVARPSEFPAATMSALTEDQRGLVHAYVEAFHAYDVDELVSLMREDVQLSMPPFSLWLEGRHAVREWFLGRGIGCRGSRLVPTEGCGAVAFGQYRFAGDRHRAWSLIVLDLDASRIASMVHFLDVETIFPRFDLPLELPLR